MYLGGDFPVLPYGSASATSSAGKFLAPTATTMNCFPPAMYVIGSPVSFPGSSISKDRLAGLLVERAELPAATLRPGREQSRAVTRKQERLRHQQRRAFRIARHR